jgi:hypothetical protein
MVLCVEKSNLQATTIIGSGIIDIEVWVVVDMGLANTDVMHGSCKK